MRAHLVARPVAPVEADVVLQGHLGGDLIARPAGSEDGQGPVQRVEADEGPGLALKGPPVPKK